MMQIPFTADLMGKYFTFPKSAKQAKKEFYEFARSRVRLWGPWEDKMFQNKVFGKYDPKCLGSFVVNPMYFSDDENGGYKKVLTDFLISINEQNFYVGSKGFYADGENYTDLIPYTTEHELYESWLIVGHEERLDPKKRHLLARRKQYRMAMKDGKAERLLEFQKKNDISLKDEYEYAYRKASQKNKLNNQTAGGIIN